MFGGVISFRFIADNALECRWVVTFDTVEVFKDMQMIITSATVPKMPIITTYSALFRTDLNVTPFVA